MNEKSAKRFYNGQAMAEFALVLPILLLVLYGVIEVGRAFFIYASVNNASREAVRFGSSDCNELNCVPLYQNCAAIRAKARQTGLLLNLQDSQIVIQYDDGLNPATGAPTAIKDTCDGAVDAAVDVDSGDRIIVTVNAPYSPIIPLVPQLTARTFQSRTARTIPLILELDR